MEAVELATGFGGGPTEKPAEPAKDIAGCFSTENTASTGPLSSFDTALEEDAAASADGAASGDKAALVNAEGAATICLMLVVVLEVEAVAAAALRYAGGNSELEVSIMDDSKSVVRPSNR